MTKPIFSGNDLDVGVGPLTDRDGNAVTGLTIRVWISADETHTTASPAAPINGALDMNLTETPALSGSYVGAFDKALVNTHLVVSAYLEPNAYIFLHREDNTGYHTVERCRVYDRRYILV